MIFQEYKEPTFAWNVMTHNVVRNSHTALVGERFSSGDSSEARRANHAM